MNFLVFLKLKKKLRYNLCLFSCKILKDTHYLNFLKQYLKILE